MKKTVFLRRTIGVWAAAWLLSVVPAWSAEPVSPSITVAPPAPAAQCPPPPAMLSPEQLRESLASAKDRGFMWRISRDGHISWLYGTLHVGRLDWAVPGPRVRRAIRTSDTIALELDLRDPKVVQALRAPGDADRMARLMTPQRQQALDQQVRDACVPTAQFGTMRPTLQLMTLQSLAARVDGFYPDYAADLVLLGAAVGAGKSLVGLEQPQAQMAALFDSSEEDEAELFDQTVAQLRSGAARQGVEALADVWSRGDLERLENYPQWCDCMNTPRERALMTRMLSQRNRSMADGIERLHAEGHSVLAAVGALHMIGDDGVVALLRARGFDVLRVDFNRPLPRRPAAAPVQPGHAAP